MKKLKWKRDKRITNGWISHCEDYYVWVQARLLHGEIEWGARYRDERPFLTQYAGDRAEAIEVCEEHRAKLAEERSK